MTPRGQPEETIWEVAPDRKTPGEWRVEGVDTNGRCFVTIFAGPDAERRATEYHASMTDRPQ